MSQRLYKRTKIALWICFGVVVYYLAHISVIVNGHTYDKPSYAILWTTSP